MANKIPTFDEIEPIDSNVAVLDIPSFDDIEPIVSNESKAAPLDTSKMVPAAAEALTNPSYLDTIAAGRPFDERNFWKKTGDLTKRFGKQLYNQGIVNTVNTFPRAYNQWAEGLGSTKTVGMPLKPVQMPPTKGQEGLAEAGVDAAAGVGAFVIQLAATKKILGPGLPEPMYWEAQSLANGGIPGTGLLMGATFHGIGKIPAQTLTGKTAKMATESGALAGTTAAMGGTPEEVVASGMIPAAVRVPGLLRPRPSIPLKAIMGPAAGQEFPGATPEQRAAIYAKPVEQPVEQLPPVRIEPVSAKEAVPVPQAPPAEIVSPRPTETLPGAVGEKPAATPIEAQNETQAPSLKRPTSKIEVLRLKRAAKLQASLDRMRARKTNGKALPGEDIDESIRQTEENLANVNAGKADAKLLDEIERARRAEENRPRERAEAATGEIGEANIASLRYSIKSKGLNAQAIENGLLNAKDQGSLDVAIGNLERELGRSLYLPEIEVLNGMWHANRLKTPHVSLVEGKAANAGDAVVGAGKGIADSLYNGMWKRLEAGKYPEPMKNPTGDAIKAAYNRGEIKSPDDIRQLVNQPGKVLIEMTPQEYVDDAEYRYSDWHKKNVEVPDSRGQPRGTESAPAASPKEALAEYRGGIIKAIRQGTVIEDRILQANPDIASQFGREIAANNKVKGGQYGQEVQGQEGQAQIVPISATEQGARQGKEPWRMNRDEFAKEFWFHGRGETHPRYGQGTTIGGITKSADAARGFARVRTDRQPGTGEISLIRDKDIPTSFREDLEGKSSYSPVRSIEWKVSESVPGNTKDPHRYLVEKAFDAGKTVPPEVMAEYPDLAEKYGKTKGPEGKEAGIVQTRPQSQEQPQTAPLEQGAGAKAEAPMALKEPTFRADPTIETPVEGPGGFAGVTGRPVGMQKKPWLDETKTKSSDADIENFFGRTNVEPRTKDVKTIWANIKQGVRERFHYLGKSPDTPEAALAKDMIRTMNEQVMSAEEKAVPDLQKITDGSGTTQALDNAGLDLLRRKVFIADMLSEAKIDRSSAGGMAVSKLEAENSRLDALINQVPSVQAAYKTRTDLWQAVSNDLVKRGVLEKEQADNPTYIRHYVLAHIADRKGGFLGRLSKVRQPYREYKIGRKGYKGDISTKYLNVELDALRDVYRDNAIEDHANGIAKEYNKAKDYAKISKDEGITLEQAAKRDGYVEWFYKRPATFYRARTLPEAQAAALIEQLGPEVAAEQGIPLGDLRQGLAVGKKGQGWIIPEWLASQLDDLPMNKRQTFVVDSFTKPVVYAIKAILLRSNPLRYNTRNAIGDAERLNVSGQTDALTKVPEAIKLLATREGELYALAKKYGVTESSLWYEMGDPTKTAEFERFADNLNTRTFAGKTIALLKTPLSAVKTAGNKLQIMTQFREDILRMATFLSNYEKLQTGKPVRHWAGSLADIQAIASVDKGRAAAKISRETMGDYGKFTPFESEKLRNGLIPFYSWMKINSQWPHIIIEATKEGAGGKALAYTGVRVGRNMAGWLIRAGGLYAAVQLWNTRDEGAKAKEESLPFWFRTTPHINIGDKTLWGQTALNDFAEWGNYDDVMGHLWAYNAGLQSKQDAMKDAAYAIAQGPVNKFWQALNPAIKGTYIGLSGRETFPNVFDQRPIANAMTEKSWLLGLEQTLGNDFRRFRRSWSGDLTVKDALHAYFAGWFMRPTDPETLAKDIAKTKIFSSLKSDSKTTGRTSGQAKSGKEESWNEAIVRQKALVNLGGQGMLDKATAKVNQDQVIKSLEKKFGTSIDKLSDAELWKMRKDATYDKAGHITKNGQVIRHSGGQAQPGKEATADAVNAELKRRGLLP